MLRNIKEELSEITVCLERIENLVSVFEKAIANEDYECGEEIKSNIQKNINEAKLRIRKIEE